jgi:hypothetical protein
MLNSRNTGTRGAPTVVKSGAELVMTQLITGSKIKSRIASKASPCPSMFLV